MKTKRNYSLPLLSSLPQLNRATSYPVWECQYNKENYFAEVAPGKHRESIIGILYAVDATNVGHNR